MAHMQGAGMFFLFFFAVFVIYPGVTGKYIYMYFVSDFNTGLGLY